MTFRVMTCALCLLMVLSVIGPAAGLRLDGAVLMKEVAPGEHINHEMNVQVEEGAEPVEVHAEIFGYGMTPGSSRCQLNPEEDISPYSARDFLTLASESASLEPGKPATLVLEGDIPEDVGSGGRYALVNIQTAPQGSGSVGVITAILVPVLLTIGGTELVETGEITDLAVSEAGDVGFVASVLFDITGNHHYGASANAVLKDEKGNVLAEGSAPGETMIPEFSWTFKIKLDAEADLESGTYTVEAKVVKSDGTVLDTEETTFEV